MWLWVIGPCHVGGWLVNVYTVCVKECIMFNQIDFLLLIWIFLYLNLLVTDRNWISFVFLLNWLGLSTWYAYRECMRYCKCIQFILITNSTMTVRAMKSASLLPHITMLYVTLEGLNFKDGKRSLKHTGTMKSLELWDFRSFKLRNSWNGPQ